MRSTYYPGVLNQVLSKQVLLYVCMCIHVRIDVCMLYVKCTVCVVVPTQTAW